MQITFLGTSHGVPEATRHCTSVMLTVNGANYIIDAGVPLISELTRRRIDLHSLKAVFLTHMHGDHANGLVELVDLLTWHYKNIRPRIFLPEIKGKDILAQWIDLVESPGISAGMPEMEEVRSGCFYEDENIRITAIDNEHLPDRPSYSYLVEAEGKKFLFTGDMSGRDHYHDFPQVAFSENMALVVTEAAHCHLAECVSLFSKVKTDMLIVSHIVPFNEPEAIELAKHLPYPLRVAEDGDIYIL